MNELRLRDFNEISRLAQMYSEEGLSYNDALKKAKEKLSSERAATLSTDNNYSKIFNNSLAENLIKSNGGSYGRSKMD